MKFKHTSAKLNIIYVEKIDLNTVVKSKRQTTRTTRDSKYM